MFSLFFCILLPMFYFHSVIPNDRQDQVPLVPGDHGALRFFLPCVKGPARIAHLTKVTNP